MSGRVSAIAVFIGLVTMGSAVVRGQDKKTLQPSGPPGIGFHQVRIVKWRANAEKPTIMLLSQATKAEIRTRRVAVTRMVAEQRVRVVEKDGKKVEQTYTVNVPVQAFVEQQYTVMVPSGEMQIKNKGVNTVQLWDLDGNKVETHKFKDLLTKSRHVFLLTQPWGNNPPIDAFYKSVLHPDVLFMYVEEPAVQDAAIQQEKLR